MAAQYRERISDERRLAVVDYVRGWLFAKPEKAKGKPRLRIAPEDGAPPQMVLRQPEYREAIVPTVWDAGGCVK